jgi:hypothetical protein
MIPRRDVLTGGLVAGVLGVNAPEQPQAATRQTADLDLRPLVEAVDRVRTDLRAELRSQRSFGEIRPIRDAQKAFLRANSKLPDFIEVGVDAWFEAYDWLVRWQQPMTLGRDGLGRYTLPLLQTTVVLRLDMPVDAVGLPYDSR